MSVRDTQDLSVEIWGGLVTNIAPTDLPHGVSPDCQDVAFLEGVVQSRPGLSQKYQVTGNPTINYEKTYFNLAGVPRFLSLDSLGVLRTDVSPGGLLTPITSGILPNCYAKSTTFEGREYLAFSEGRVGRDLPRRWDDATLNRVSQVGPGAAPQVADENISYAITASPNGIFFSSTTVASRSVSGSIVTLVLAGAIIGLRIGDVLYLTTGTFQISAVNSNWTQVSYIDATATLPAVASAVNTQLFIVISPGAAFAPGTLGAIAGAGVAGYDGIWEARNPSVVLGSTSFGPGAATTGTPANTSGLGNSGNGTLSLAGRLSAGVYQLTVIFVTDSNYFSICKTPTNYKTAGGKRALVTGIPTGPPNVKARILSFTAVNGSSFYHLGPTGLTIPNSGMYIPDNFTGSLTVDFDDATLLLGTLDDPLFDQIELPPQAGVLEYKNRLAWWGGLNLVAGFTNLSFDGGFSSTSPKVPPPFAFNYGGLPNYPLGWTPDPVSAPGGDTALGGGLPVVSGDAYAIVGNGVTAVRGLMSQSAAVNSLGNPILQPGVAYTVRARLAKNVSLGNGTVHINLVAATVSTTGIAVDASTADLTQQYQLFEASLCPALDVIPADLVLRVYADGTPTHNGVFLIDSIEIFPTDTPVNASLVQWSKALGGAETASVESYDPITGAMLVSENNGFAVRSMFKIRERVYIVKEQGVYATQDDGVNEPSSWTVDELSTNVGTPSINGVGGVSGEETGEDWSVIAGVNGLHIFWGGEFTPITPEIQQRWDLINWAAAWTMCVSVDIRKRRIYVLAPFADTKPDGTLVLDYHDVGGPEQIASMPPVHVSSYTGKKVALDKSRKWCPWTTFGNVVAQIVQPDGTTAIYFGSNDRSGNINLLDDAAHKDDTTNRIQLLSDNFNRNNENPIGAPWSGSGIQLFNQQICPIVPSGGSALYAAGAGATLPADQYAQATLRNAVINSGFPALLLRADLGFLNYYDLDLDCSPGFGGIGRGTPVNLQKFLGGIILPPPYHQFGFATLQIGDVFRVQVTGASISVYQNEGLVGPGFTDPLPLSATGHVGVSLFSIAPLVSPTDNAWDDFSAGSVSTSGAIPAYYVTAGFPDSTQELPLQLGSHRKLFTYLTVYATGAGQLPITLYPSTLTNAVAANPLTLASTQVGDLEMMINESTERLFVKFAAGGADQWFAVTRLTVNAKKDPWSTVRGA